DFGRSNEAENVFRRAWLNTTSHGRTHEKCPLGWTSSERFAPTDGALLLVPVGASPEGKA
ncbi:MAG: hypothetical protein II778_01985, partial [Anaerovibrio sp.]|nr:hypothetical protein [Anaerovibrio sp.]